LMPCESRTHLSVVVDPLETGEISTEDPMSVVSVRVPPAAEVVVAWPLRV